MKLINQIEINNKVLMTWKDELEESRVKVHNWLKDSHVTEMVKQKEQIKDKIVEAMEKRTDCLLPSEPTIVMKGIESISTSVLYLIFYKGFFIVFI